MHGNPLQPSVANCSPDWTCGWDFAPARFYFLQGFFATLAVLYPYFGRAFTTFGYHNRVASSVVIGIVIIASLANFTFKRARNGLAVLTVLLLILAFLYADPLQRSQIFRIDFDTEYYSGKLSRLFQICLPVFLLGYLVSSSCDRLSFVRGTWWAIFASGLIGLGVVACYGEYLLGQTNIMAHDFKEDQHFSTISLSVVISMAMILVLQMMPWKGRDFVWLLLLSLAKFFAILLLRQRAHLIMLASFVLARFWTRRARLVSLTAVAIAFALGLMGVINHYGDLVITETVRDYWRAAAEGHMMESRMELAALAIEGIRDEPMGYGLGAFALHHRARYPHNRLLEASYELGIPGALCVGAICFLAAAHVGSLFVQRLSSSRDRSVWFLHAAVLLLLAHGMKAGSLEGIHILVYFLFIAPRRSHGKVGPGGDPSDVLGRQQRGNRSHDLRSRLG